MPTYSVIILVSIVASLFAMFVVFFIYQQIKAADRVAKMYAERNAKREVIIESLKRETVLGSYPKVAPLRAASIAPSKPAAKPSTRKSESSAHSDDCLSRHVVNSVSDADWGSSRNDYSCGSSDTSSSATCD